jgi:hypothetical protein
MFTLPSQVSIVLAPFEAVRLCLWRSRIFPRPTFSLALALFSEGGSEQLNQLLAAPF